MCTARNPAASVRVRLSRAVLFCVCAGCFAAARADVAAGPTANVAAGAPAGRDDGADPQSASRNPQSEIQNPKSRPVLPDDVATQVAELEKRIAELRKSGLAGDDKAAQDASLAEAIELAERVMASRLEHQGPGSPLGSQWTNAKGVPAEWYEVGDARRAIVELRLFATLTPKQRVEVAEADEGDAKVMELYGRGEYAEALALTQKQLKVRRRVLGDEHPDTLTSIINMGGLLLALGKLAEAGPYLHEALERSRCVLGDHHPRTLAAIDNVGGRLHAQGKLAEAEPYLREALERSRHVLGNDHTNTLTSINNVGGLLHAQGKLAQAQGYYGEALQGRRRVLGDDHPLTITSIINMGGLLLDQGKLGEAGGYYREALERSRRVLGDNHPNTLISINNMGALLEDQGKLGEAEPYLREALERSRHVLGDDHPHTLTSINNMGYLLLTQGKLAQAQDYYGEALQGHRRVLGNDHPSTLSSISGMGAVLKAQGKPAEAEPYLREALERSRRVLGDDHPLTLTSINSMGGLLLDHGKLGEAEPYYREALEKKRRVLGDEHPSTLISINNMGYLIKAQGKLAEAEPYYREALEKKRRVLGDEHPSTLRSIYNMGYLLLYQGKPVEAEPLHREALAIAERLRVRVIGGERSRAAYADELGLSGIAAGLSSLLTETDRFPEAWSVAERGRARALLDLLARDDRDLIERALARAVKVGDAGAIESLEAALKGGRKAKADLTTGEALLVGAQQQREHTEGRDDLADDEKATRLANLDRRIAKHLANVKSKRRALGDAVAKVNFELRGLFPDARPMSFEQIHAGLERGELLLGYTWTGESVQLQAARGTQVRDRGIEGSRDQGIEGARDREGVWGFVLAKGKDDVAELTKLARRVQRLLADQMSDASSEDVGKLLADLIPQALRSQVRDAERLIVLPDGPLNGIPFEPLAMRPDQSRDPEEVVAGRGRRSTQPLPDGRGSVQTGDVRHGGRTLLDDGPQIVYASSATVYLNRRIVAREQRDRHRLQTGATALESRPLETGATALVLGDPIFDRDAPPEPAYPANGVLLVKVTPDSNAAKAGLSRGDVLLSYGGSELADSAALGPAITAVNQRIESGDRSADERVKLAYWRDGRTHETTLSPGRMGVQPSRGQAGEGLRSMARTARDHKTQTAEISATDQIRLHGGPLQRLPGTGREAAAIARVVQSAGGNATLLLREDATIAQLSAAVAGKRILHLATHGLTGNAERPYDASLALTRPKQITPDDIGFLRLGDLIAKWRGKLKDCDLVVLSACDTQRGIHKGTGIMALPWGFFYAGVPTVVASLWQADDDATMLLMTRFYGNLLGQFRESRPVGDRVYAGGTALSKADALREAKLWLRSLTSSDVKRLRDIKDDAERVALVQRSRGGIDESTQRVSDESTQRGIGDVRKTVTEATPSVLAEERPYSHPYYWAAFILLGAPD